MKQKARDDGFSWINSSTVRFYLYTLISFLIIVIFVSSAYYILLSKTEKENRETDLLHIKKNHIPIIVQSLWITDYATLRQQIAGIVSFSYIERVEVRDEEGTLFYVGSEIEDFFQNIAIDLIYSYRDEQKKIGLLNIYVNNRKMGEAIIRNTLRLFLVEIILSFALAAILATIFYWIIGRHLLQLAQFLEKDDPQKKNNFFNLSRISSRNDELQILVNHFNKMRDRMGCYISEMQHFSYQDQLTSLYNHRFFAEELRRLDTDRNLPLSVIVIDLNNLKLTNDTFGHLAGNQLLIRTADILKREFRADEIIARIGGDEFVVLLPKTGKEEVETIVNRIITAFNKETVNHIPLSASFGWNSKTSQQEEIAGIFKKAEDQMYNQKIVCKNSQAKSSVDNILLALFKREPREKYHAEIVSMICRSIARAMEMKTSEVNDMEIAGKYHDIGKIAIDTNILNKKGALEPSERREINRHSELGHNILNTVLEFSQIAEIVLYHHERWDGKGYPVGLSGEKIPLQSRILLVADAFAAMTDENRPCERVLNSEGAVSELKRGSGTQFDPGIVDIFLEKVLNKAI